MTQPAHEPSRVVGATLGRYRIDGFIGEGGMGQVYRAFDATLGRSVAIKILPERILHDSDRLERFVREARTASSLNHPNVVTIHEIGSATLDGAEIHFMAMELLDGETLRQRLSRERIDMRRAIEWMAQVAEGVAAAHAAGVIHRDLKPENIVITKTGFVKILDFGLAKLREPRVTDESATAVKKTDPGTVMGSVGYMSPEQAAGREVDHRTDIFALGCILYELVGGRRAFTGESSVDTLHKIMHDDPVPLREVTADIPPELQRIVRKSLAKDPDERYQSAKDMAIDLRELKREIDSQPRGITAVGRPGRWRGVWLGAVIIALLVLAAVVIPLRRRVQTAAAIPLSVSRITASGNVIGATISPDGEYVAYAYSDAGQHSLWLRQLATSSTLQLVPPSKAGAWGLSFAPDSRSIYYAMKTGTDPGGALYQISILGGTPRRLLQRIDGSVTFSPDGKRIAFIRANESNPGQSAIVVVNVDGTGEKVLIGKAPPDFLAPIFWGAPSWSPNGKLIAAPLHSGSDYKIIGISADDGREQPLSRDRWGFVGQVGWLHDMSGLILVGSETGDKNRRLWLLSYPEGQRKPITNDLFDYRMISLTNDDKSLVSVASDQTGAVWRVPLTAGERPTRLTHGKYDGLQGIAGARDRVVFTSQENGKWDLWSVDNDGGNRKQLTTGDVQQMAPAVSPDDRFVVFAMPREREWVLARMNRDGSDVKVLCTFVPEGAPPACPVVSSDSRSVFFLSAADGVLRLWKVSIDGGTPVPVFRQESWRPTVSPDGKWVAFGMHGVIQLASLTGSAPVRTFKDTNPTTYCMMRWTEDGKGLLHNCGPNDRKNVWLQAIDGSPPRQVTHFDDEYILHFDVVPGGKELVVVRGILARDAVLIKNFR